MCLLGTMTLKCKICGVSNSKILKFILNHKHPPQFIGFIVNYPKSRRYVELEKLKLLCDLLYETFSKIIMIK